MAKKEQRFIKVMEESGFISSNEVLVDTETGVQYLYHAVGNSGGLTLLVDALSLVGLVQTLRGLKAPLPGVRNITKGFHPFD